MSVASPAADAFRSTEIGDFPTSWQLRTVGDLFELQQGKALSPEARRGINPRPFLRTVNVLWGRINTTTLDQMDFSGDEMKRLSLRPRDLLVCEGGEIGRTAVWTLEINDCFFQNHLHRLRRKTDEIEPEFVMYWMQAAFLRLGLYGGVGNKTTIPNLSGSRLKQLPVPVPPVWEQRAIAGVLSKLQARVELQGRVVATLKELKAATMAKLFREGLRGGPLKQTEIGEIPESWEVVRLGEIVKLGSGKSRPALLNPQQTVAAPVPVFGGNGLMGYSDKSLTTNQSVVIGRVGAYCGAVHLSPPGSWITDNALFNTKPVDRRVDLLFLAALLSYLDLNRYRRTGAQPLITQGTIEALNVPIPGKPEQEQIARVAGLLEQRIDNAARRVVGWTGLFSVFLKLLTGGSLRLGALDVLKAR